MSPPFTLKFLKEKVGAEYVEHNPITGKPRIIRGLNEVWNVIESTGACQRLQGGSVFPHQSSGGGSTSTTSRTHLLGS